MSTTKEKTIKPIAVCISDIHFNLNTLPLASKALRAAIAKAESLLIPLVIAGDLHDSKAIIRAEVANELISILKPAECQIFILVGNHDLINEKDTANGLNYLKPYANIINKPIINHDRGFYLIPYYSDFSKLTEFLNTIEPDNLLFMHQGFQGAFMGDYVQDKTSISPDAVVSHKVISGHYHKHQTIGSVTYIGSPFTMTFGEANDGPKGFLVVNSDGSFTREILELRKHVIATREFQTVTNVEPGINPNDLLWLRVTGPKSELKKLKKQELGQIWIGHSNFKLELIEEDSSSFQERSSKVVTDEDLFDTIIDSTSETAEHKVFLKKLWRDLV